MRSNLFLYKVFVVNENPFKNLKGAQVPDL